MTKVAFYDPAHTFEDNLVNGPFDMESKDYRKHEEQNFTFLGFPLNSPFGIAAGSLPTHRHTDAAFRLGFDVVCYKTQRSGTFPCNPFPNVVPVELDGDLTLEKMQTELVRADDYPADPTKISITNSFGVPSRSPETWTKDMKQAIAGAGEGQLLVMSVMGTIREGMTPDDYHEDFAVAAKLAKESGAQAIEINLSCPNVASEGVICYSYDAVVDICRRVRAAIGETPLIIKVGYYSAEQQGILERILTGVDQYISAVSAINTLAAPIVNKDGSQALPGDGRLKAGVCGAGIKWAGLDMVKRLDALRKEKSFSYEIVGVGGVMSPEDFKEYRTAGADLVQSVTGAMWNPHLALDIKASL